MREGEKHVDECHFQVFNTFLIRIPFPANVDIILEHSACIGNTSASARTLATLASKLHCPIFCADFTVPTRPIIAIDVYICSVDLRDGAIKMIPRVFGTRRLIINARRAGVREAHVAAVLLFIDKSIAPVC